MPVSGAFLSASLYADNAAVVTSGGMVFPKYAAASELSAAVAAGHLVVTGRRILFAKGSVTVESKRADDPNYIYDAVKNNVFVQPSNAPDLAQLYLTRLALKRRLIRMAYRGYPYLLTGDIVNFLSGGAETQPFFIYKNALSLSGGMSGELEAREL